MRAPLIRLATQIYDTPLAIIPEKLDAILHVLQPRLDTTHQSAIDRMFTDHLLLNRTKGLPDGAMDLLAFDDDYDSPAPAQPKKPYSLTSGGVAVIPIRGTLLKKSDWMSAASGLTSYASITSAFTAAIDDDAVKGILFDVDSPGGTTHGCFELADLIYSSRKLKPIYAACNDLMASAAYALGSSAEKIFQTRTGASGSIGVFMLHCDQEGADKQMGVQYTYIFAGDKKVDGNPHEALSRSAKKDCQAEVDRQYQMFVDCVSRNRSASPAKIQSTEAGIFSADSAIPLLADSVGTFDDALSALTKRISGPSDSRLTKTTGKAASTSATIPNSPAVVLKTTVTSAEQGDDDMSVTLASLLASASPEEIAQLAALASASKEDGKPEGRSEPKDKKMKSKEKEPEDDDEDDDDEEKKREEEDDDDEDEPEKKKGKHAKKEGEDDEDDEPEPKRGKRADDMKKSKKSAKKEDEEDCEPGASRAASTVDLGATIESISDMCMIAKRPDLIASYTKLAVKGRSLAAIRAKFQDARAAGSGRDPIDSAAPERTGVIPGIMGSATDAIITQAATIARNSAGKLPPPAALSSVLHANPSLYEAFLNERSDAQQSRSGARQYHEAMQARMKRLGLCANSDQLPRSAGA